MKILVLNAGSSSQKSCLYELSESPSPQPPAPLWEAKLDWTGKTDVAHLEVETAGGASLETEVPGDRATATSRLLDTLCQGETQVLASLGDLDAVGHRVVHGGEKYRQATRITPEVKAAIAELRALAPAHNPINLQGIEIVERLLPEVPQVAVFDTAFHSQIPPAAATYPLPYELLEQGVRRYGFHGINHEYCLHRVAQWLAKEESDLQIITCHLGNGCSLSAIRDGVSVDTTMGYTPLEGLMMGSRSGSIDPGILIHLMRDGYDVDRLDNLLNKESGLKGVSGVSNDMRAIDEAIAAGNERARLALDVYLHRLRAAIGAMLMSLDRLDAIVFTGGIGEHSPLVREGAIAGLGLLGVTLDPETNPTAKPDIDIATPDSTARVLVVKAQEDWAIARTTRSLLSA